MAYEPKSERTNERRVLVLAVPDALDTRIALCPRDRGRPHFVSCGGPVDGATECTTCGEFELTTVGHDLAVAYRPTHLLVRDDSGGTDALARCASFLEGILAATQPMLRRVIQTHPGPRTPSIARYDAWLKRDARVRELRSLDIIWHEALTTTLLDCRGVSQLVDDQLAWQRATAPARAISRRLRDASPRNLEYTVTGTT